MAGTRLLSPRGYAGRLIGFGLLFALTALGTAVLQDNWWPLAPQKQYATGANLNGAIRSAYGIATTTTGKQVRIPWGVTGVGIGRAEIEGQLQRFVDNPSLLQSIAVGHSRKMPHDTPYAEIDLMQKVTPLKNGIEQTPQNLTLAHWKVRDPLDPAKGMP